MPPQPCDNDYIVDHVARHSLVETDGGWTWRFDPRIFQRFSTRDPIFSDYLAGARCRVAVIHGELSGIVTDDVTELITPAFHHAAMHEWCHVLRWLEVQVVDEPVAILSDQHDFVAHALVTPDELGALGKAGLR